MVNRSSILQNNLLVVAEKMASNKSFWLLPLKPNSEDATEMRWRLRNLRTLHQKYGSS